MTSILHVRRHSLTENIKRFLFGYFTEYETQKLVSIHSTKFAVLLRSIQIIILIYSGVYFLLYEKGYQKSSTTVIAAVTLKVKGIGFVNESDNQTMIIDGAGLLNECFFFHNCIMILCE